MSTCCLWTTRIGFLYRDIITGICICPVVKDLLSMGTVFYTLVALVSEIHGVIIDLTYPT